MSSLPTGHFKLRVSLLNSITDLPLSDRVLTAATLLFKVVKKTDTHLCTHVHTDTHTGTRTDKVLTATILQFEVVAQERVDVCVCVCVCVCV